MRGMRLRALLCGRTQSGSRAAALHSEGDGARRRGGEAVSERAEGRGRMPHAHLFSVRVANKGLMVDKKRVGPATDGNSCGNLWWAASQLMCDNGMTRLPIAAVLGS